MDTPYTIQPGGCGDPGEYIHITPGFLENLEGESTQLLGPTGKLMCKNSMKVFVLMPW